jgi:paraquat-inducible protein B
MPTPETPSPRAAEPAMAKVKRHGRFSPIWLIPLVAAGLVFYLGYSALADRGPTVTIILATAEGLTVDQTEVKHKAVTIGTVESIKLSTDTRSVVVQVRMVGGTNAMLTDRARFWVVRPRLSAGSLTGIETLVSGPYIEVDPGEPGGKKQRKFTALTQPPGRQWDEPGQVYVLKAKQLGSLSTGSPVYYRDVEVGQVLSYDLGAGLGPVTLRVFVREPFDKFVHTQTQFWNASGLSVTMGAEGMRVVLQSIQTLLSGGIAFETPFTKDADAVAPESATFDLFKDKAAADNAFYRQKIPYVTYFRTSVQGLSIGSPVQISGVQVGSVSDLRLVYDPDARAMVARVAFDLQPERILSKNGADQPKALADVLTAFSESTMHVRLESSNFLTGSKDLSIAYAMGKARLDPPREGDALVLPSEGDDIEGLTASLADIANKVDKIPFAQIADTANAALASIQHLANVIDTSATPALLQLPGIVAQMSDVARSANGALGASGYGRNSEFQLDMQRMIREVNDAARSFRGLTDYLDQHPESLIRGRETQASGR